MNERSHLYFHAACFDGAASAAITWDYLASAAWNDEPELHPVDYSQRESWLGARLPRGSAVVDFLYHPDAKFWADHHPTAFLSATARRSFAQRRRRHELLYDPQAPSCARVLMDGPPGRDRTRAQRFEELVLWADKIDAARYDSAAEAISGDAPAQRISAALARDPSHTLADLVVRRLRNSSLHEVASIDAVASSAAELRIAQAQGLTRIQQSARMAAGEIVVFDVDVTGVNMNRYAPFYLFPNARYSAGIVRDRALAKLTAMRNPWLEFESAPIGKICSEFGGGGHQRVGSILFTPGQAASAVDVLRTVTRRIQEFDAGIRTRVSA